MNNCTDKLSNETIQMSDDIRRSIDVLDQVLSEFDDIEPLYSDEDRPQTAKSSDGSQEEVFEPPPIDRSLKPRSSPPSLPQKTRRSSSHESLELSPSEPKGKPKSSSPSGPSLKGTQTSVGSKRSESSSHEYQEINNEFSINARSRSLALERNKEKQRHQSGKEHTFRSTGDRSRSHFKGEAPLRKSRSEDISLIRDDSHSRGWKNGGRRHTQQRRGRSSDRFLDHRDHRTHPLYDPRQIPELEPIDPRLGDPNLIDPMFSDPRFFDPRFIDPRFTDCHFIDPSLQNQRFLDSRFIDPGLCDPRLLDAPLLDPPLFDVRIPFDSPQGHYPIEDSMPFPHLMSPPISVPGTMSLPSPNGMELHPHSIPPFDYPLMQGPVLSPDHLMDYPYPIIDPHFKGGFPPQLNGFDPRLKNLDPGMFPPQMRNQLVFPMDYPLEFPFNYPPEFPPMPLSPRERLHYEDQLRRFPLKKDSRVPCDGGWLPPSPEEARKTIQRLVRSQKHHQRQEDSFAEGRENYPNDTRQSKSHNGEKARRSKSASNSDSSGRSSPFKENRKQRDSSRNKNQRCQSPKTESSKGVFHVGEAVRKDSHGHREFGGKDTVSLPHFVSGGKDSGFEESPVVDEASPSLVSPNNRGSTPSGVGGGFIVAGVFSDSSKMYIPAPPSPTPDYDNELLASDGEDSDIPQEPFYVKSKVKKENSPPISKTSSGSTRDSLSEDSLQEIITYEEEAKPSTKTPTSLQSMIAEFRMGLPSLPAPPPPPPPSHSTNRREDGRFSDDSLEDDEVLLKASPATTPTANCGSKRPDSVESLESMDASSTSFDYVPSDSHSKKPLSSKKSLKDSQRKNELNNNKPASPKKSMNLNTKNPQTKGPKKSSKQHPAPKPQKSEQVSRKSSSGSHEKSKKDFPKFDTIKHLIKEGLIEGLDETPPDFAPPPPPPKMTPSGSNERADSGIGSTASTNNRTYESGGSDNQSDKLSSTSPKNNVENISSNCKTPSPPPLPPPRDSSMSGSSCSSSSSQLLTRNQSWLYKKQESQEMGQRNLDKSRTKEQKNLSKHNNNKTKREKVTHVDDLRRNIKNSRDEVDNKIASQYATPQDDNQRNELNRNLLIEKSNKLYANKKRSVDVPSSVNDEEASVSSHGSRSSRFFSRFTESMKSNSRSNSPQVNKNANQQRQKRVGTKYHADIIRAPRVKGEAPQPPIGRNPPQFKTSTDPPPITSMNRDGSGRFRSIEDLPDISSGGKSLELKRTENHEKKKKKNSTLPPTITPSDVLEHEKVSRNRNRDDVEGSKFKFNIFKGFWRRNKYSFDKM